MAEGWERKVAASFGGELIASHRNAHQIEQHFGSKGFHDMKRLMQAVRHGVPSSRRYRGRYFGRIIAIYIWESFQHVTGQWCAVGRCF